MRRRLILLVLLPAAVMLGGAPTADAQILSGAELFPVKPTVNDQRGFAISMDGSWLAIDARLEDLGELDNAGAVHLFHFETGLGTWKEKPGVTAAASPKQAEANGQFGSAVVLRGDKLAVGEPGASEGAGAVHIFLRQGSQWVWQETLRPPAGEKQFGRSVALDGIWLAVGAGDPHGDTPGSVRLYKNAGSAWNESLLLAGSPGERFGQSVSLQGHLLAIGAPGADSSKGTAYVYRETGGEWEQIIALKDPGGSEGDQLGFAVATNGQDVVVGEPTAGSANEGAAWVWRSEDGLTRLPGNADAGGQLGYAVAIDGARIAVGAPFEGTDQLGSVHVFSRIAGVWSEPDPLLKAENADLLGALGFSVATSGEWVMLGAALADQGGGAAGSVSSLRCRPGQACKPRGEVAIAGEAAQEVFGISVAADGDVFAVGARKQEAKSGSVTLFRRSSRGWHQEERLTLSEERANEFGAAVALHRDSSQGDLLVVGEPYGKSAAGEEPGPPFAGAVHLFRKQGEAWRLEAKLLPPKSVSQDRFGRSVATDGETVVVGAQKDNNGAARGAAYAFQRQADGKWSEGLELRAPIPPGSEYGAAVAVHGDTIVASAPQAHVHGRVYVFTATGPGWWATPDELLNVTPGEGFGTAVAYDGETLAVGAPLHDAVSLETLTLVPAATATPVAAAPPPPGSDAGAVYLYQRSGSSWSLVLSLPEDLGNLQPLQETNLGFGSAVALRGADLVVGAPVVGWVPVDVDKVFLFHRKGPREWSLLTSVDAIPRIPFNNSERSPVDDDFGSGVAIGEDFFVATSPGVSGGDRILLIELDPNRGKETP